MIWDDSAIFYFRLYFGEVKGKAGIYISNNTLETNNENQDPFFQLSHLQCIFQKWHKYATVTTDIWYFYWILPHERNISIMYPISTGIPSPPLALFIAMLPKAHLTSHSKMSGSRWRIKSLWLSGSWRSFLNSSSVYYCHLFLISSASVRPITYMSILVLIFAWNVPLVSVIFLKRSLVFPILLFSSVSLHWSLRKAFLFLLAILWNSAFKWEYLSFSPLPFAFPLSRLFVRPPQQPFCLFAFLFFFPLGDVFDHCLLYNGMNFCP